MAARPQTSVRISARALTCLSAIASDRGVSRDQAVRELLLEHVTAQETATEDRRLSHISTVLRFPPPRPDRGPDGRVRLAVRLEPAVAERAIAMSLRLPGQAVRRGYRDYGARPLTDAVVTAIARVTPFVDDGLEGLPPLLTQREALGLWRLTVAATLTRAELRALLAPQDQDLADALREQAAAWHDPWRFEVALHLARRLLTGPEGPGFRRMLYAQTGEFEDLRDDLELSDDLDHKLLHGLAWPGQRLEGRGGAAVWRAGRVLAVERLAQWLIRSRSSSTSVEPPGWTLTLPQGWQGHSFAHNAALPARLQMDLDEGRVLRVDAGSRSVLWPYDGDHAPISGFDAVIAGAGGLAAAEVVELVLVDAEGREGYPRVPATAACDLGFITASDSDELVQAAAEHNRLEVKDTLRRAQRLDLGQLDALRAAVGDPPRFARLARGWHLRCHLTRPIWTWPVESIASALVDDATPAQLRWLAGATREVHRYALERSMERASREAFWLGGTGADHPV